jgi:hypothetical protein
VLGGRYRVTAGIYQSARGNVCRATYQLAGGEVIVKQARALVGEDAAGNDARARLRNERRILQAVDGVAGVPHFLDHFPHGDDELGTASIVDFGIAAYQGLHLPGATPGYRTARAATEWPAYGGRRLLRARHDVAVRRRHGIKTAGSPVPANPTASRSARPKLVAWPRTSTSIRPARSSARSSRSPISSGQAA